MTQEKFLSEVAILKEFFEFYCQGNKHQNEHTQELSAEHNGFACTFDITLCPECYATLHYALERLENCEQNPKIKCRTCTTPCYDKQMWKKMARVMRYSGIRLGTKSLLFKFLGTRK